MKPSRISTMAFVGMTCALVASIRNIPDVAAGGWTMFAYMLIAVLCFTTPIALMSGEFAGMFPGSGGPELWATNALGGRWGFVTSWLLWVQMFPGMVMVASVLAPLIGDVAGSKDLGSNSVFTLVCILAVYWLVTALNMRFDMAHIGGKIGVWLGLYIPVVIMMALGFATLAKTGVDPKSTLGAFDPQKLLPDADTASSLKYLVPIFFIFIGIEMSSVYITRLANPVKSYIKGIVAALIFIFAFNVLNGFVVANVVPAGKMELNNIAQSLYIYCEILGLPKAVVSVFCLMVAIGVAVQLSAWATGPSKTITESARRGLYPPKFGFWKVNRHDVSVNVLVTQAVVISAFALIYLLVPSINEAFLTLVNATTIIYCVVYVIMAVGILRLRKTRPDLDRPFKVKALRVVVTIFLIVLVFALGASFALGTAVNAVASSAISVAFFAVPLIIFHRRKASWETEVKERMGEGEHTAGTGAGKE